MHACGNAQIGVQPALGVEGDPMRLLYERDLTPHPQYAAFYKWLQVLPRPRALSKVPSSALSKVPSSALCAPSSARWRTLHMRAGVVTQWYYQPL
eukprot:4800901-Pyramimonas_sp.AAC.2